MLTNALPDVCLGMHVIDVINILGLSSSSNIQFSISSPMVYLSVIKGETVKDKIIIIMNIRQLWT